MTLTSATAKRYARTIESGEALTNGQITQLQHRASGGGKDSHMTPDEALELMDMIADIDGGVPITPEQHAKAERYLRRLAWGPKGEPKESPFGYREKAIILNIERFTLTGYRYMFHGGVLGGEYVPVYCVWGARGGNFEYHVQGNRARAMCGMGAPVLSIVG